LVRRSIDPSESSVIFEDFSDAGVEKRMWRHNDLAHLEDLLRTLPPEQPKIIAFESVYSMEGDIAPPSPIASAR